MSLISKNTARYKPFLTPLLTKSFSRRAVIMLLSVATLLLTGCGEEPNPPAKQVAEEQPSRFSKDKLAYRHSYHPEWPKEVRNEVYGDEETFSTPRILFKTDIEWTGQTTLFSARMDLSDRRRIIPETAFEDKWMGGLHKPVRSPDNRYIALSMDTKEHGLPASCGILKPNSLF
jgi:hypothetical protein